MNIDYEAIAKLVAKNTDRMPLTPGYIKQVIDAYESQKAAPEWVPLDLATVKQGQEVRCAHWDDGVPPDRFVCAYKGTFITDDGCENLNIRIAQGWLMRVQKPKTVRVRVFRTGGKYAATTEPLGDIACLGEGDIEVSE